MPESSGSHPKIRANPLRPAKRGASPANTGAFLALSITYHVFIFFVVKVIAWVNAYVYKRFRRGKNSATLAGRIVMLKTRIFKALALGLLSYAFFSGPAAAGPSSCPAFSAGMVDAVALRAGLTEPILGHSAASDNPLGPSMWCDFATGVGSFYISVSGGAGSLVVLRSMVLSSGVEIEIFVDGMTTGEVHACRSQVLQSFIWNQHCAPLIP